jgi:hypothetical protein
MVIMALCATEKSGLENCGHMLVMMLGEQNPEVASQACGAGRHLAVHSVLYIHPFAPDNISASICPV